MPGDAGVAPAVVEWPGTLDVDELRRRGWRPVPFRQFVVKLHSRCNLACDYCYLYTMADQTWRSRPRTMARPVQDRLLERIAEHATAHRLDHVSVVLHGGEPLLAGPEPIGHIAQRLRQLLPPDTGLGLTVQTNGLLLDDALLGVLHRHGYRIGVSLDGDRLAHDRHRRHGGGRGSYDDVAAALRRLGRPEHRDMFAGLLCTIDLANDPVRTYEALLAFAPPLVDFLLPHGNWSSPPPGRVPDDPATPYGDWLIRIFDRWYDAPRRETGIRLFEEIIGLLLGGASRSETIGLSPYAAVVVDTDGSVEQVDTLKSAYHGAAGTGLNVLVDDFDAALGHPGVAARQLGPAALGPECRRCDLARVCGGGCFPHRYRAGAGFANRSVYCADLYRLITHVRGKVMADVRQLLASADAS